MTPSEAARAVVEAWARRTHRQGHAGASCQHCLDELARDLTPVYERAQKADAEWVRGQELAMADFIALRERAEAAEAKLAKIEELATPFVRDGKWVRIDDHPPTWYEVSVEVAEACLKLSRRVAQAEEQLRETLITAGRERERAERAEAERDGARAELEEFTTDMQENNAALTVRLDAAEAALAAARETCNRLNRRCQAYEAGLAEKIKDGRDRSGWGLGRMLANAAASMYEADVRRLREALAVLADDDQYGSGHRFVHYFQVTDYAREALAATALKGGK